MAIPISYNIRNLRLRKGLTIMTALGIALTVTTAVFLMALLAGLKKAFMSSGDPVNVLVMRKGSVAELSGGFDASLFPTLKTLPGIAKDGQGEPLASGEWVVVVVLPRKDGTGEVNVSVRGLMPAGLTLRPNAKLVEGRWFTPGQREVVVGQSIHHRFSGANVGDNLDFAKGQWKVVGVFDSGGTAYDSKKVELKVGDVLIVPPGVVHGWADIPDHVDYLSFRPSHGVMKNGWVNPTIATK